MNKENSKNYIYENDFMHFESSATEFSKDLFKKFEAKATKLELSKSIDNLFSGEKINNTENLAAWHPKYREKKYNFWNDNTFIEFNRTQIQDSKKGVVLADNIISIGIGGSFEGPKLLLEAIGNDCAFNHIFITGSDPFEFKEKTEGLDPKRTVFVVSSKSFKTDETLNVFEDAIKWSQDSNKFLAITANKSEALKYNFKYILEFDKEIGGRFSIWSIISLPAFYEMDNIARYMNDSKSFCAGGNKADMDLKNNKEYQKFVKILAYSDIWLHNTKNKNSRVILSYIWKLRSLPDYLQQLEMESLGKKPHHRSEFQRTGQIVFGGYGPTAQHSYFQLLHQGTQNTCADIIASEDSSNYYSESKNLAFAQAVTQAELLSNGAKDFLKDKELINGNVPVNLFLLKKINAYNLGYLIATWEHRTFITAMMLEINPFDQFGVNAGKIYTNRYLTNKN